MQPSKQKPKLQSPSTLTPPVSKTRGRVLDLFSGTGSVAAVYRRHGYEVVTLDADNKFSAYIPAKVEEWDYKQLPVGHFTIIFAAPLCTEYSQALTSRPRKMDEADKVVQRSSSSTSSRNGGSWRTQQRVT